MKPESITPDQLEVNSDTSEASFGCALDLMAKDADAKSINEIKIKDERIDANVFLSLEMDGLVPSHEDIESSMLSAEDLVNMIREIEKHQSST